MSRAISGNAVVIRVLDSGEADKYISLITEKHGLVSFVARGSRRPGSKKSSHLDLLNQVRFQSGRGENPRYLEQVESVSCYPGIKNNFNKTTLSFTVVEILTSALPSEVEDRELYLSLIIFLDSIEKSVSDKETELIGRRFYLYLLRHLGYPEPKAPQTASLTKYFESIISKKLISPNLRTP